MLLKILAMTTIVAAVIASGCGLAIHFKWVGEMAPKPHWILGGLVVLLALTTAIITLLTT